MSIFHIILVLWNLFFFKLLLFCILEKKYSKFFILLLITLLREILWILWVYWTVLNDWSSMSIHKSIWHSRICNSWNSATHLESSCSKFECTNIIKLQYYRALSKHLRKENSKSETYFLRFTRDGDARSVPTARRALSARRHPPRGHAPLAPDAREARGALVRRGGRARARLTHRAALCSVEPATGKLRYESAPPRLNSLISDHSLTLSLSLSLSLTFISDTLFSYTIAYCADFTLYEHECDGQCCIVVRLKVVNYFS